MGRNSQKNGKNSNEEEEEESSNLLDIGKQPQQLPCRPTKTIVLKIGCEMIRPKIIRLKVIRPTLFQKVIRPNSQKITRPTQKSCKTENI